MSFEPWALVGQHAAVRFTVTAEPSPGLLPRLIEPFARRDLVPDMFEARVQGETTRVEIRLAAMPAEMVHLVEGNLGAVVGVVSVQREQEVMGRVQRRAA
jgi:hypothetical protein